MPGFIVTIPDATWNKYLNLRGQGLNMTQAARAVGISYASAKARERLLANDSGRTIRDANEQGSLPEPVPLDDLCDEAKRALDDFGYFRARYLGRISTPWQEEAAYKAVELLDTPRKEYLVSCAPPGSGKSTLWTLDIPLWLTCRNRAIRGLIGSASQRLAERYLRPMRMILESPYRFQSEQKLIEQGLATDAVATLSEDFGFFKPQPATLWSNQQFIVAQHGNLPLTHKDPTWSAFGLESALLGGRYDFVVLDDLISEADVRTSERIETHRSTYDMTFETRLEPGGLLVVNGQRLSAQDLYHYLINKPSGDDAVIHESCCDNEDERMYHLIRYPAHNDANCDEDHGEHAEYAPKGCLLDPRRLPWRELKTKEANGVGNYRTMYQQEDADPEQMLVQPLWVTGGTDPTTGEDLPGCWDNDRGLCELPKGLKGPLISVASIDPSPTQYWGVTWWIWAADKDIDRRYLMDLERRKMNTAGALDWNNPQGEYTGLMEEWQQRSIRLGWPITHWVYEANAAQRDFITGERFANWKSTRKVNVIPHQTSKTKQDPKYGVYALAPLYHYGKVRLPGFGSDARTTSLKLIKEVQEWRPTGGSYDDLVMSSWFFEHALLTRKITAGVSAPLPLLPRASWQRRPTIGTGPRLPQGFGRN